MSESSSKARVFIRLIHVPMLRLRLQVLHHNLQLNQSRINLFNRGEVAYLREFGHHEHLLKQSRMDL